MTKEPRPEPRSITESSGRISRTLATRLVRKGMPLEQVSKILGHESLSVTMRYVETDKELLRLIHKKHTN